MLFSCRIKNQDALYSRNTNKTNKSCPIGANELRHQHPDPERWQPRRGVTYSDPVGMVPKMLCQPQTAWARLERENLPHDSSSRCCSVPPTSPGPTGLCVRPQLSSTVPDKQGWDDGLTAATNKTAGDLKGNMKIPNFLRSKCRKSSKAEYVASTDSLKCQEIEILQLRIRLFRRFTKYSSNSRKTF